jgi:hypothetical protein
LTLKQSILNLKIDASSGTVDIEYNLVEKGSSQIELQGGYGGGGLLVHGAVFNNFRHETCLIRKRINLYLWVMVKSILTTSEYIFRLTAFRFQNRGLDKKTSSIQFFDIVQ